MANVEQRMVILLKADNAVKAITTRIQPMFIKQIGDLPAITYQRISTTPLNHATGTTPTQSCRIQIDCWHTSYLLAKALGDAVEAALNGTADAGGNPSISQYHMTSRSDDAETPQRGTDINQTIYRDSQDYIVWYSTT